MAVLAQQLAQRHLGVQEHAHEREHARLRTDQRADVESGETYWMRDKYQELQKLAAEDPEPAA